jgi:phytoene dehydrogenase-like protein
MAKVDQDYDVIIIGGGINGLTAGCYLQKAGLKVLILERRDEVGTFCSTQELLHPGAMVSVHANGLFPGVGPVPLDLDLDRFGFELLMPGPIVYFAPFKNSTALAWHWYDPNVTYDVWKRVNAKDAETFRTISKSVAPLLESGVAAEIFKMMFFQPMTDESYLEAQKLLDMFSAMVPVFPKDALYMTGVQILNEMWEDDRSKIFVAGWPITLAVDITSRVAGSTIILMMTALMAGAGIACVGTSRGGSHNLTHALARCFVHHGGKLLAGCPVAKIIMEGGEAKGVALSKDAIYSEAEFRARKAVISNLSPYPTFIQLVGEEHLPKFAAVGGRNFDYRGSPLFTTWFVLKERPQWKCIDRFPEIDRGFSFNFGAENMADVLRMDEHVMILDTPPDPPVNLGYCIHTFCDADPTQAPPGQYNLLTWANVPTNIRPLGGPQKWDDIREEYGDKVENSLSQLVPNLKRAKIARYCDTPWDTWRRNPSSMGHMSSGYYGERQWWSWRPFPGCNAPRTPIPKLYISNSMGSISVTSLGGGYTCAKAVADDLGVKDQSWWASQPGDYTKLYLQRIGATPKQIA